MNKDIILKETKLFVKDKLYKEGSGHDLFHVKRNSDQNNLEGKIVQDADRLDTMGAIGIARAFTYGGSKNRLMYDPHIKPKKFQSLDEVKTLYNHIINHFYEKLLKLKDLINTDIAKQIAEESHRFMEIYLDKFYYECNFNEEK